MQSCNGSKLDLISNARTVRKSLVSQVFKLFTPSWVMRSDKQYSAAQVMYEMGILTNGSLCPGPLPYEH